MVMKDTSGGAVDFPTDIPRYYELLSLRLYQVLEEIGINTELRNIWKEVSITGEILQTLANQPLIHCYHFGSSSEGTTTMNRNPDFDAVMIDNRYPVITDCSDGLGTDALLLIKDSCIEPGYAKLQFVRNGVPLFGNMLTSLADCPFCICTDMNSRLVCGYAPNICDREERHGPALYIPLAGYTPCDLVTAVSCSRWPACASEWLTRTRNFDWPPQAVAERCENLGFLLVPVGHPRSDEQDKQWRLSFSHQERLLVSQFSSLQLKCYVLLKLVKKDVFLHLTGQESLTSYHLKTCMFYIIESTPSEFWRPSNLLICFEACLKLLLIWSNSRICPNYFIPAENMFDRLAEEVLQSVSHSIRIILSSNCKCLLAIQTDAFGLRLSSKLSYSASPLCTPMSVTSGIMTAKILLMLENSQPVLLHKYELIQNCFSESLEVFLKRIRKKLLKLQGIKMITTHTETETKLAVSQVLPLTEPILIISLLSLAQQQNRSRGEIWQYLSSEIWYKLSLRTNKTVRLKQASLMFAFGYYHASLDVLSTLEHDSWFKVCLCYKRKACCSDLSLSTIIQGLPEQLAYNLVNRLVQPCVQYLPTEKHVTPSAVCYEMLRFVDSPAGFKDNLRLEYLKQCALLDPQFLFYFLLYLNHNRLNMRAHGVADIENMKWVIFSRDNKNDFICSHRESCLNVLGWVYMDQGHMDKALQCFKTSLDIKPVANAAAWHIRDIGNITDTTRC